MTTKINPENIIDAVEGMSDDDLNDLVSKIQKVKLARERKKTR